MECAADELYPSGSEARDAVPLRSGAAAALGGRALTLRRLRFRTEPATTTTTTTTRSNEKTRAERGSSLQQRQVQAESGLVSHRRRGRRRRQATAAATTTSERGLIYVNESEAVGYRLAPLVAVAAAAAAAATTDARQRVSHPHRAAALATRRRPITAVSKQPRGLLFSLIALAILLCIAVPSNLIQAAQQSEETTQTATTLATFKSSEKDDLSKVDSANWPTTHHYHPDAKLELSSNNIQDSSSISATADQTSVQQVPSSTLAPPPPPSSSPAQTLTPPTPALDSTNSNSATCYSVYCDASNSVTSAPPPAATSVAPAPTTSATEALPATTQLSNEHEHTAADHTIGTSHLDELEEAEDDSGTGHDDHDASGCAALSAGGPAKAANHTDLERLVNLQSCLRAKVRHMLMSSKRSGMEMFEKLSLSGGCSGSLVNLMSSLSEIRSFAFKFLDASAKVPSGMLYGLLSDFGDFDQCISIRSNPNVAPEHETEERAYSGKYCLMSVKMNYHIKLEQNQTVPEGILPDGIIWDELVRNYWTSNSSKGFQIGMCFPSRCTDDDLEQLYRYVAESYNVVGDIISCQTSLDVKRQHQPDLVQQTIIYAFYALILVTILGTTVTRYHPELAAPIDHASSVRSHCCGQSLTNSLSSANGPTTGCSCTRSMTLRVLACFSISKNWQTFMRKDHARLNPWECLISSHPTGSSPVGGGGCCPHSDRTSSSATERMTGSSVRSTSNDSQSSIGFSPSVLAPSTNNNGAPRGQNYHTTTNHHISGAHTPTTMPTIPDKLFEQLTVQIQPDNAYLPSTMPGCDNSLGHLSGLKLFIIFWITSGHSFLYPSANNYQHYRSIINMNITRDSVWFATTNFTLGIDMLLYMSGLVFVYKLARLNSSRTYRLDERLSLRLEPGSGGIATLISKKILRFWPTYLTVIALAIVVPLVSDGPMWPEMVTKRIGASCRKHWWANLLFINNFLFAESEICLPSSWFVSVLMQLFLIGSLLILLVRRCSLRLAVAAIVLLLFVSCGGSFALAYRKHVRAPVIRMDESFVMEMDEQIFKLYTHILNCLGPFLIGMLGGFWLVNAQMERQRIGSQRASITSTGSSIKAPPSANGGSSSGGGDSRRQSLAARRQSLIESLRRKKKRLLVWQTFYALMTATLISAIAVLVLSSVFHQHYTRFWASVYWSLHRVGWAIVTGYVVHKCATGNWKLLNDFLSLSTFIPFSRLIFIAYLIYPIFIHLHSGHVRDGLHISLYNMMNIYFTRLVMTFATALCIHLLVELPFCSIEELYLSHWVRKISNYPLKHGGDPSKLHPLLAVAPVVSLQISDHFKLAGAPESLATGSEVDESRSTKAEKVTVVELADINQNVSRAQVLEPVTTNSQSKPSTSIPPIPPLVIQPKQPLAAQRAKLSPRHFSIAERGRLSYL